MSMMRGHRFSPEEVEELREAFILFDEDGKGLIGTRDLQNCIAMLGYDEIEGIFELLMKSPDMDINFDQFCDIISAQVLGKDKEDHLSRIFKYFDFDGSQKISVDDLENAAKTLGENMSRAEMEEMIKIADLNNNGMVDLNEFIELSQKTFP